MSIDYKSIVAEALKTDSPYAFMLGVAQGITKLGCTYEQMGKELEKMVNEWNKQKEELA